MNSKQVRELTGVTYRQLDHWCFKGLVPGQPPGRNDSSGYSREFTREQAEHVNVMARLVNAGINLEYAHEFARQALTYGIREFELGDGIRLLLDDEAARTAVA